jgi:tRNA nucleotidyltransferase/poly(A) polymerase
LNNYNWKFTSELDKTGLKIVKLIKQNGFGAFWVGGAVRDRILRREYDNLDIATSALPDNIEEILGQASIKHKDVGKQYGTILAVIGKNIIEITTFRSESDYRDKRHPNEVRFIKNYTEDARRRDLTINSLYFDPMSKVLLDPCGGQQDIKLKLVRFVGDPRKRIDEDYLRMLRAVRISTQLGFRLEKNTYAAIKTRAKLIQNISGERIKTELDKLLLSKRRVEGIRLLDEIGLLKFIIPEMDKLKKFSHQSKNFHLEGDMLTHTLATIRELEHPSSVLLWTMLFHDISKPKIAKRILMDEGWVWRTPGHNITSAEVFRKYAKILKFSKEESRQIEWLILNHDTRPFYNMTAEEQILRASDPRFKLLLNVWNADLKGNTRRSYHDDFTKRVTGIIKHGRKMLNLVEKNKKFLKLNVGEKILKYRKVLPGPKFGELKKEISAEILLGRIKNDADLKNFLKK